MWCAKPNKWILAPMIFIGSRTWTLKNILLKSLAHKWDQLKFKFYARLSPLMREQNEFLCGNSLSIILLPDNIHQHFNNIIAYFVRQKLFLSHTADACWHHDRIFVLRLHEKQFFVFDGAFRSVITGPCVFFIGEETFCIFYEKFDFHYSK